MYLTIFLTFLTFSCSQLSPLNINNSQVQMVGFLLQSNHNGMNFTTRFPIMQAYNILFRFRKINSQQNASYLYLSFKASTLEPISVTQQIFNNGKLQDQTPASRLLIELSKVNAQSYDQFRYYTNVTSSIFSKNTIYQLEIYLNPNDELSSWNEYRMAYFHTYLSFMQKYILLPRFMTQDNFVSETYRYDIHLFTGGVGFQGESVYFIGIIIQNNYTSGMVNMWGGFSYSRSHINRDMVTFIYDSTGISVRDTFSLLGRAPYEDISSNVGGTNNIQVISSEQDVGHSVLILKRLYNTGDRSGDQVITNKLNQQYCLALYTRSPSKPISIQSSEIHNYLKCVTADIRLGSFWLRTQIILILLFYVL